MARAKRASDEAYNVRRRAKRYISSLEKQLGKTTSDAGRRSLENYIGNLKDAVRGSYQWAGKDESAKSLNILREQTRGGGRGGASRANFVFQQQIGLASKGKKSTLDSDAGVGQAKAKIFYRATQRMWEGAPPQERNKRIMAAMGTNSLSEAYEKVMAQQGDALQMVAGAGGEIEDTDESKAFQQSVAQETETSPDYIARVVIL